MAFCLVRFVHFGFLLVVVLFLFLLFSFKFSECEFGQKKINTVQINIFLQTIQSGPFSGFVHTVITSLTFAVLEMIGLRLLGFLYS